MSKIVVTDEMITAGYDAADGEIGPANVETIYRTMAALDPSRRAPSVTREEIAEAAERILAEDAQGCFHHLGAESPDDCINRNRECPCRRLTLDIADAILALLRGE